MDRKPKSFLDITDHGNPMGSSSNPDANYSRKDTSSLDERLQKYTPTSEGSSSKSYFDSGMGMEYLKRIDLSPDIMQRVDSNAKEMARNNRHLEQRIKSELSGLNIFKKGKHFLYTLVSPEYRNQTADDMINRQLRYAANFRDSIKSIYTNMRSNLERVTKILLELESRYLGFLGNREKTKAQITETREDFNFLKQASPSNIDPVKREQLRLSLIRAETANRQAISNLDQLNHSIVNNVREWYFDYQSQLIFERFEAAFRKVYDTAESELRKIETVKGLYLDAIRGGKVVKDLEKSFEAVFSSLRLMDNVLSAGVINLLGSSSQTRGRINELRMEKSRNSQKLLDLLRDRFPEDAAHLNSMVDEHIARNSQ